MISYLQVENLTKSFGDLLLFENIAFGISDNQRVALIAKNGTGKTTLLNIIAGIEDYDGGTISFKKDLRIGYLEQSPSFPEHLSVIDACLQSDNEIVNAIAAYEHCLLNENHDLLPDIMHQMDLYKAWDYEARIKQILGKLKIVNFEQKIGELSGGQLKRVALANVIISEPDLLILDEPTTYLDDSSRSTLYRLLHQHREAGGSTLLTTHQALDVNFLNAISVQIGSGSTRAFASFTTTLPLNIEDSQVFSAHENGYFLWEQVPDAITFVSDYCQRQGSKLVNFVQL